MRALAPAAVALLAAMSGVAAPAGAAEDARIEAWAAGLTDDLLAGELEYRTISNSDLRRSSLWLCVAHFFNHQTHHRGQLTALLAQAGRDYGVTDLLGMPRPETAR